MNYRTEDSAHLSARKSVQVTIKRMSARFIEFGGSPAIMTNQHHFTISALKEKSLIRAQCYFHIRFVTYPSEIKSLDEKN